MIIVSRPVLTTDEQSPVHGIQIMGRYLNATELDRFQRLTQGTAISDKMPVIGLWRKGFPELHHRLKRRNVDGWFGASVSGLFGFAGPFLITG